MLDGQAPQVHGALAGERVPVRSVGMPRSSGQTATAPCPRCGYLADPSAGGVNFCPKCGNDLRDVATAEDTLSNPWLHTVVAERYRLLALLGEGGMGAVYKAEHIRMGKALALKVLRGDFARQPGAVARFRAEAQIVSRLSHPNTIAVFDFGEIGDAEGFYLAMEYVPGEDLADLLAREGRIPETRAAELGAQLLGSLAEAHDAGIVHRDVKPANVMVTRTRQGEDLVKVLDFGIAKWREERGSVSETNVGAIIGTPSYLAPEQARSEPLDGRADLYAVGALLYELVSGHPPFVATNPMAVVASHLNDLPPPLEKAAPGVSKRFAEIVHRALRKRPEERFASADEMREALLRLEETPVPRAAARAATPAFTGELQLASRDDFREFDRQRQLGALKRSHVAGPLATLVLAGAIGLAAWRWDVVHAFLTARAPELAARLPATLRPADRYDGAEHEPNDGPAAANVLPLDARGAAVDLRGRVGVRLSDALGDVDVLRVEVPPLDGRKVLVAEWWGASEGEGIRGLDVALTLNRAPPAGAAQAPLVGAADRGGVGRAETLVAAVDPGVFFLAVRERHPEGEAPVEKPTDLYLLRVRLAEPRPGEEVEPNDAPWSEVGVPLGWAAWEKLAARNPLAAGESIEAELAPGDADTFSVRAEASGARPALVVAVPDAELALAAEHWSPDAADLAPPEPRERVRFERAAEAGPGAVLFLRVPPEPADAPLLVRVRAEGGEGRYTLVALGEASIEPVRARVSALAEAGRTAAGLELAAGVTRHLPDAADRAELVRTAADLAKGAAPALTPEAFAGYTRASQLLGAALFEPAEQENAFRYTGAFEALLGPAPSADVPAPGAAPPPGAPR
jgi:eukaryotic-like serine/threonine-protein kinase